MRGMDRRSGELFSYVDLEKRVRPDHPLRAIRSISDEALEVLSEDFRDLYSGMGRPSVAPEKLLRAMLLQAFHSIRSERQLMERLEFDLLFRWFVGLGIDDAVWDHSTFSKNRDRLLAGEIAAKFLSAVLARPRVKRLLSTDHFSVDGTLVDAWASMKSFKPRDGAPDDDTGRGTGGTGGGGHNAGSDFRGERRSNATHESTTDTDAMLYRKGPGMEARLCYIGHGLMENRSGLIVDARLTRVSKSACLATGLLESCIGSSLSSQRCTHSRSTGCMGRPSPMHLSASISRARRWVGSRASFSMTYSRVSGL